MDFQAHDDLDSRHVTVNFTLAQASATEAALIRAAMTIIDGTHTSPEVKLVMVTDYDGAREAINTAVEVEMDRTNGPGFYAQAREFMIASTPAVLKQINTIKEFLS